MKSQSLIMFTCLTVLSTINPIYAFFGIGLLLFETVLDCYFHRKLLKEQEKLIKELDADLKKRRDELFEMMNKKEDGDKECTE